MARLVATILVFACPVTMLAQAQQAWIEQFDGKKLEGWHIDGDSKIENGMLILGGKAGTKLRLQTPLGDAFHMRLEYRYSGHPQLNLRYQANGPEQRQDIPWASDDWTELDVKRRRGNMGFGYLFDYSSRTRGSAGSGGLANGDGDFRVFELVVASGRTLTIRRIALQTSPPGAGPGSMWVPIITLVFLLLGIMGLGWFLNRRRAESPASGAAT